MTDTLEPTVERLRHTFQAVADQVVDAPPVFHAVPVTVAAQEDTGAELTVVDIERTRYDRTRRARWLAAAAALVAVLLVAATVLVTGTGQQHVRRIPAGPGPAPTTVTPGTVLPLAQMQGSDLGLDLPERPGAGIGAVAVGGLGLVAVGSDGDDAAVWTSVDGQTWSRVPDDEAVFGGPGFQGMSDVAVGGPGFVAVGRDSSIVGPDTYALAAVWTSPDGISWSRVAHDDAVFGRATGEPNDIFRMTAVTTGGPGLVAIGERGGASDQVEASGGWIADRAVGAVWTSIDGITWSRVPHDPAVFGHWPTTSPGSEPVGWGLSAQMRDITPGGPGLVVVGNVFRGGFAATATDAGAVWTSPDGLHWTLAADQIEAAWISAVTAGGPGLVAVGATGETPPTSRDIAAVSMAAVWTSPDGTTWSRVPSQADVLGGPEMQTMDSVAAGGPGFVATGHDEGSSGDALTVWTSVDGITWSRTSDHALPDTTSSIETVLRLYGFDGSRPGSLAPVTD